MDQDRCKYTSCLHTQPLLKQHNKPEEHFVKSICCDHPVQKVDEKGIPDQELINSDQEHGNQEQKVKELICRESEVEGLDHRQETTENFDLSQEVREQKEQIHEVEKQLYPKERIKEQVDQEDIERKVNQEKEVEEQVHQTEKAETEEEAKEQVYQKEEVVETVDQREDVEDVEDADQSEEEVDEGEEFDEVDEGEEVDEVDEGEEVDEIDHSEEEVYKGEVEAGDQSEDEVDQGEEAKEEIDLGEQVEEVSFKEETKEQIDNKDRIIGEENIDTKFEDLFNKSKEDQDQFEERSEIKKQVGQIFETNDRISTHGRHFINEAKQRWEALDKEDQSEVDNNKNYKKKKSKKKSQNTGAMADANTKTSRFGGTAEKCAQCKRTVYAMEKLEVAGRLMHKTCFRCCKCNSPLNVGRFSVGGGDLYCLTHYKQAFREKGTYDVFTPDNPCKGKWQPKAQE